MITNKRVSINKEILGLAIPNIISNVSVPLLSTVDTALMGHLSSLHLGAVGIGSMIFNFLYWNFGFLRMGTTGITAQAYGRSSQADTYLSLYRGIIIALIISGLILLFRNPLGYLGFELLQVSDNHIQMVKDYFMVRIYGAPASLLLYVIMGWFFGMQNAYYPLVLTICINVVNIITSWILVQHYNAGVQGVAFGTVIAQYAGVIIAFILYKYKYSQPTNYLSWEKLMDNKALKSFLTINRDIFIRTLLLTTAFVIFYSQSSVQGPVILAVNVVLLQFVNWMSYGIDGFAYASESIVGKYIGAKDVTKEKQTIKLSFVWGYVLAIGFSLTYLLIGPSIIGVFTNQSEIISAAQPYMFWVIMFPVVAAACYIWDGIFTGYTASKAMRQTMLYSFVLFLIAYNVLRITYGNHGLWAALLLFVAARGLFQWLWYRTYLQ